MEYALAGSIQIRRSLAALGNIDTAQLQASL